MTLSPKGNQPKQYEGAYFLKVDSFGGEALSEFLVSLFLESTSFKDFVPYRYIFPNISKSPSYKPRYSFIPMFKIVLDYLYTFDMKLVNKLNRQYLSKSSEDRRLLVFRYWMEKRYLRLSIQDRVLELQNILKWYPFDFNVVRFVELLQTELDQLSVLNLSNQWSLMKRQLHVYFPKDINGVDTLIYLESKGL